MAFGLTLLLEQHSPDMYSTGDSLDTHYNQVVTNASFKPKAYKTSFKMCCNLIIISLYS